MAILDVTTRQISECCRVVHEPSGFRHAPHQLLIDHFAGEPHTTFLRCSFPERFGRLEAEKLHELHEELQAQHGPADIVFCVYFQVIDVMAMARHAVSIADR